VLGDASAYRKHSMGTRRWTTWSIKCDMTDGALRVVADLPSCPFVKGRSGAEVARSKVFFLVCEKIPVGSEKNGFRKYRKYRPKYR
jgi:hypothetical protein